MKRIRILLADDHRLLRMGLATLISFHPDLEVVGEAADGEEAVRRAQALEPDVIVMDLMMPKVDGAEATRRIHRLLPKTRILILTTFGTSAELANAIRAGASGALVKDTANDALIESIRAVARGETTLSPEIRSTLAEISAVPALTPRQQEILSFVKRGLTNQDISKALSISADAVKQHLGAICRKLGAANRTEAVALAMRPPFAASCVADVLPRGRMRRMIRREHQHAVLHAAPHFRAVFARRERRRHLEVAVIADNVIPTEQDVVRRRLGRHGQPLAPRGADERDAFGGRDVLDVEAAPRLAAEREVAADAVRLGEARRERVLRDDEAKGRRAAHRLFHHLRLDDITAVIREERRAALRQRLQIGDFASETPLRETGGRQQHGMVARQRGRLLSLIVHHGDRVAGRRRVRHRDDGGEAPLPRGGEARGRRLRRRHARIAEVDVHIDEAGEFKFFFHAADYTTHCLPAVPRVAPPPGLQHEKTIPSL